MSLSAVESSGCRDLFALKEISSEHVIKYYDHFDIDFNMFIVVEYCQVEISLIFNHKPINKKSTFV